jgi:hypothetical protein
VAEGANLDYESRKSYALHVRAYNEFGASNNISINININDLFDVPPIVANSTCYIDENSFPNAFICQLNIVNNDSHPVTSIFLSGDGAENFKAYNNGTIVVAEGANLDYESRKSYALHVRAYNEFGASNNASIKMNINDLPDTPPVFLSFTQYFYVYEYSQSEAVVGKLIINNVFSPITSIVLSGDGAENFKVYNNGTIVVADGANINYKNKDFYSLSAVAHNEYGESNVGYIAIFVNDIPNPNISSGYLNINENSPSGTFVGKLSISDYDNLITYIYFEGDGSEDFDVALDGTITVANGAVLDYETRSYYNLRVFAENKYGESGSANIDISLRNIPDSPPFVSGTIIELDKNAQDGDEIGYAYISSDGSGVDNMHLSGEGSENFDLVYNDCNYGCSAYIVVAEGANLEYFDESMHKIYISASNEFGSGDAIIWLAAGKGSEVSPPEFNNITFVTFGSSIEEGDDVGIISPSSKIHCEITEYFTDNDKFAFIQRYEYIEIIANEFIQSGEVYNVNMYANSTCGVSNDIVVTIDTKNRLTTFDIYDEHHYGSLSLIDNETKLFVGGNYETDFTYVVDLKNSENSRSVDLKIGEGEEALLSAASKDGRYLYVIACEYDTNCALNVYDMSSPYNPALLGQLDMDAAYTINEYNPKIVLSKDGSKLFLQGTNIVVMVDISDPYLPVELSRIGLDYEYAMGMLISSDEKIIYITTYNNFGSIILARYDISSLHNPVKLAPISFYGEYAIIGMSDDNAFAYVSGEHGLVTYDISDTNNPIPINLYSGLQESYHAFYINTPVTLNDNKLLVSDKIENPFTIFDFSNPKKPYISVTSAYSSYFYLRSDLTVTTNKSKVFAVNSNIFMIDIEGIGK